ncbi:hypothetical protein LOAG_13480, partial [Loa loa]
MDFRDMITCANNSSKHSSHNSKDKLSSIDDDDDDVGGDASSDCDSVADTTWSSEVDMSYQQSNFTTQSLLLHQQYDDKNDKSTITCIGNGDREITLSLYNSDTTKDDDSNSDSDEEFAIHACLRGFIKSKSISTIQKHNYAAPISYADNGILDGNTFITKPNNDKCLNDGLINTQSISDGETSASSAPYFLRNRAYHNYRTPIFKTKSNINIIDNWPTATNNFKYGMDFESDDDDLDQARSSPFTCCWSAPEFIGDNEQQ